MYTITGVTGHVGPAAARELLHADAPVRVVVRDPAKGERWTQQGAQTAIADFNDRSALAMALAGSRGAFILLPTVPTAGDAEHRRLADSITAAVADSGIRHVVLLSSVGADLAEGTGPIRWLHHLENGLHSTGVLLTALRCGHFQERVEAVLDAAVEEGIYPVFGDTADVPISMVATADIGKVVAEALLAPPPASETIDLGGPEYTEQEVAAELAAVLGKPLQIVTIPRPGWVGAMVDAGLPAPFAHELAALNDAEHRGLLQPRGDRRLTGTTPIGQTLRQLVGAAAGPAPAP